MNDRFERNQRTALFTAYDKILEVIKNELVLAGKNRYIRLKNDGKIVVMGFGKEDKVIFNYDLQDFFNTPFENFKVYSMQVVAIESEVLYDPKKSQNWKIMLDDVLMKFQSNEVSKDIDVVLIV
jgi:hypothetical protein